MLVKLPRPGATSIRSDRTTEWSQTPSYPPPSLPAGVSIGHLVESNLPLHYPKLDPGIRWLFVANDYRLLKVLLDQGFQVVHRGRILTIAHARECPKSEIPIFWNFARTQNGDRMSILGTTRWRARRVTRTETFAATTNGPPGIPQADWPGFWMIGRVARSHRCLGSHNGAHDSVIACRALNRPNPHDATADRSILEPPVASTHDPALEADVRV